MPKHFSEKANLEMTLEDHKAMGSTPPRELVENPGKTVAETMDDGALLAFMQREVASITDAYEKAKEGVPWAQHALLVARDDFLAPNVRYLREIGRLPAEFADLDPKLKFAL